MGRPIRHPARIGSNNEIDQQAIIISMVGSTTSNSENPSTQSLFTLQEALGAVVAISNGRPVGHHVVAQQFEGATKIASVESLERSPNDLHVLLRHRLLREPGGLEGIVAVREPVLANDLPLAESDNDPVVELNSCAALPAAQFISEMHQDLVGPRIHEFGAVGVARRMAARPRSSGARPQAR
jgi:hypothetical protein